MWGLAAVFFIKLSALANCCRIKSKFFQSFSSLKQNTACCLTILSVLLFLFFHPAFLRFASLHKFPSIVLRSILQWTMWQSVELLFSINSIVILALFIALLMLQIATLSVCSPRLGDKSHFKNPFTPTISSVKCVCVCVFPSRQNPTVLETSLHSVLYKLA